MALISGDDEPGLVVVVVVSGLKVTEPGECARGDELGGLGQLGQMGEVQQAEEALLRPSESSIAELVGTW